MSNYAFKDPGDDISDRSIIDEGNFMQLYPDTEILKGKTLMINGGNWVNVKAQPEWTINGGNWTQINRCSHVHPELVAHGLVECENECEHMTSKDEVIVDGELVDTIYEYEEG